MAVENSTVLSDVFLSPPISTNGSHIGRLGEYRPHAPHISHTAIAIETAFVLPCLNEGLTRVTYKVNTSSFIDGILYRRDYKPFFYRNCTKDRSEYNFMTKNICVSRELRRVHNTTQCEALWGVHHCRPKR